jgi:hypothetical protein
MPRGPSNTINISRIIKKAMIENPAASCAMLTTQLAEYGLSASLSTIQSLRADCRVTLRLLAERDLLKEPLASLLRRMTRLSRVTWM